MKKNVKGLADLPEDWRKELSRDALRDAAGDTVFKRGVSYFKDNAVTLLSYSSDEATCSAIFEVLGSEIYTTELCFEEAQLHTECSCPHAYDGAFCKHMVAAGLFWHAAQGSSKVSISSASMSEVDTVGSAKTSAAQKRAATVANNREALKSFVFAQDAQTLAQQLWSCAESDRDSMAVLKSWHALTLAEGKPDGWKASIAAILGNSRSFYDWRESNVYARQGEAVLPLLDKLSKKSPETGRTACAYALRKLYKVAEHADDSSGEIGYLAELIQGQLLAALKAAPPPGDWLDEWLALMEADPRGDWSHDAVLDVAGLAVQQRYSAHVAKEWGKYLQTQASIGADNPPNFSHTVGTWDYTRSKLRDRYVNDLKRQGDSAAVCDVMQSSLEGAHEYGQLVAYFESLGKTREALDLAIKARKAFPDDWRSEEDVLRCYERDGWDAEALQIRRKRFDKQPIVANFVALLDAAKAAGQDVVAYRESLYAWAAAREVSTEKPVAPWFRPLHSEQGRDVSTRVQWLLYEKKTQEALDLVQLPHTCSIDILYDIAKKIRKEQPEQALALLHRVFAHSMPRADTPYKEVLALVADIVALMPAKEYAAWITRVRTTYKPKRNFIKGLDALGL